MNRRKLLFGIAASLGAVYGLKAGGLGLGKVARKVGKHPALAAPYRVFGDTHFADFVDKPPRYYLHKSEWVAFERAGFDMTNPHFVLLGDIPSGSVHDIFKTV